MPKLLPYISLLIFALGAGLYRWKNLSQADRWICLLLFITIIQEWIAYEFKITLKNNYITYHIYTPIEVLVILFYFDKAANFSRNYFVAISVGILSIILGFIETFFLQKYYEINSLYLLYEGCLVITLCMFSFYKLLIREDIVPNKMAHFWITICFLFYWCLSYINLGLFSYQIGHTKLVMKIFGWTLYGTNLLFYSAIAFVFLRYKKLIPSGE